MTEPEPKVRMIQQEVVGRQGKGAPKTRFECLLTNDNYDFLCRVAREEGLSMSAAINQVLLRIQRSM